jgi:drug/metabolite transporter (DMT)-like permease
MKNNLWIAPTFILIWSTGFIIARYGMPYSEPMTFLFFRFAGVLLFMIPAVMVLKPQWPTWSSARHIAIAGLLIQFGYLGGVWAAVHLGMPAGLSALIVGLQPVLTAILASFVAEKVTSRQWLGLVLGLVGVTVVLFSKIRLDGLTWASIVCNFGALVSMTWGTMYQKKYCPQFDLRAGSIIQFTVSAMACLILMFTVETREVQWNASMIGALIWGVLPISIGAMSLWFILLRKGEATKVSSLMYLTPPTTAVMAWFLFDEPLTLPVIVGTVITMLGVLIVNQPQWFVSLWNRQARLK